MQGQVYHKKLFSYQKSHAQLMREPGKGIHDKSSTNRKCSSAITVAAKEKILQTSPLNGLACIGISNGVLLPLPRGQRGCIGISNGVLLPLPRGQRGAYRLF